MSSNPTDGQLRVDELVATAKQRAGGLDDFGDGPFLEPLGLFVDSLNRDARLNDVGRYIATERAVLHVRNRLQYIEDRKRHPGIAEVTVERPVFIVGLPRTGTTILHDILAQDPANRAPLTWELAEPSPPPTTADELTDPRIAAFDAGMYRDETSELFRAMHPTGAMLSQECVVMMGDAMVTPLFHNQFDVRGYQDWVDDDADWAPVYDFHRIQLQHLWWAKPRDRWVLKTGAHLWGLSELLATYPDARIVFTHRDPVKSMTSFASLTCLVRSRGSDHVDRHAVAADWTSRLRSKVLGALEVRSAVTTANTYPNARFYDMHFTDFAADNFAAVEAIYDALDLPMSSAGESAMVSYIADHPKGVDGIHRYEPEEYGVDPDEVRDQFAPYIEHFGLEPE